MLHVHISNQATVESLPSNRAPITTHINAAVQLRADDVVRKIPIDSEVPIQPDEGGQQQSKLIGIQAGHQQPKILIKDVVALGEGCERVYSVTPEARYDACGRY